MSAQKSVRREAGTVGEDPVRINEEKAAQVFDLLAARRVGVGGVFLRREHNADVDPWTKPVAVIDSLADIVPLLDT